MLHLQAVPGRPVKRRVELTEEDLPSPKRSRIVKRKLAPTPPAHPQEIHGMVNIFDKTYELPDINIFQSEHPNYSVKKGYPYGVRMDSTFKQRVSTYFVPHGFEDVDSNDNDSDLEHANKFTQAILKHLSSVSTVQDRDSSTGTSYCENEPVDNYSNESDVPPTSKNEYSRIGIRKSPRLAKLYPRRSRRLKVCNSMSHD